MGLDPARLGQLPLSASFGGAPSQLSVEPGVLNCGSRLVGWGSAPGSGLAAAETPDEDRHVGARWDARAAVRLLVDDVFPSCVEFVTGRLRTTTLKPAFLRSFAAVA